MNKVHEMVINKVETRKSIEDAITFLRTLNYRFILSEDESYGLLVRKEKGKFIYDLYFRIKLYRGRKNRIEGFYRIDENHYEYFVIKLKWQRKKLINFRKMKFHWTFPDYLTHKQRREWRAIYRKLLRHPDMKPPQWYLDALPGVTFLLPIDK